MGSLFWRQSLSLHSLSSVLRGKSFSSPSCCYDGGVGFGRKVSFLGLGKEEIFPNNNLKNGLGNYCFLRSFATNVSPEMMRNIGISAHIDSGF